MTCNEARDRFSGLLDGTLDDRAVLDAHMLDCAECRREWERFQRTVGAVRSLPQHPAPEGFASGILERIQRAELLAQPQVPAGWRRWSRPGFVVKGLAAAAVLLVMVRLGTSPKAPEPKLLPQAPAVAENMAEFRRNSRESLEVHDKASENKEGKQESQLDHEEDHDALASYGLDSPSDGGKLREKQALAQASTAPAAPAAASPAPLSDGMMLAWVLPARQAGDVQALASLDQAKDDNANAKNGEVERARQLGGRWDPRTESETLKKTDELTKAKDQLNSPAPRTLVLRVPASRLPQVTKRLAALGARPLPSPAPQNDSSLPADAKNLPTVIEKELSRKDAQESGKRAEVQELRKVPKEQEATATSELAGDEEPWVTLTITLEEEPESEKAPEPTQSSDGKNPP